ncbi:MAG: 2-dehydropantoate 2-reductase [Lachnospiraceae bacterium]|nr:2-dehydropantoate 2-reductase [Lachnospiraceae bacterium]
MKYLVIGAGGTGGAIGGFMTKAGKDVTLIARGSHLAAMQKNGLNFDTPDGKYTVSPIKACTMEEYADTPDVIFVCVKGYSLEDTIPFIRRIAGAHTVVIPILNIYGTGGRMQKELPELIVTDGCIYIASEISEPGSLFLSGKIFRVVYGLRKGTPADIEQEVQPVLTEVKKDLEESGIEVLFSNQIEVDALQKFSFVSPMAGVGAYYNTQVFAFQVKGQMRSTFFSMVREIKELSDAMGVSLPDNIEEINEKILDNLAPTATASMQRDIRDGKPSEIDGLIFEVIRLGKQYGVETPVYEMIAEKFR